MPATRSMRPAGLARQIWFWTGFAAITAAILISTYLAADRLGHERLRQEGLHRLELYAAALESELAKYEYLPDLLTWSEKSFSCRQNPPSGFRSITCRDCSSHSSRPRNLVRASASDW